MHRPILTPMPQDDRCNTNSSQNTLPTGMMLELNFKAHFFTEPMFNSENHDISKFAFTEGGRCA